MKNLKLHIGTLKNKLKYSFIISKILYINPSNNFIEKVILNQIHQDENIDKNYIQNPYSENRFGYYAKGLYLFSTPMVVAPMWPGRTLVSSGSRNSFSLMEAISSGKLPP